MVLYKTDFPRKDGRGRWRGSKGGEGHILHTKKRTTKIPNGKSSLEEQK